MSSSNEAGSSASRNVAGFDLGLAAPTTAMAGTIQNLFQLAGVSPPSPPVSLLRVHTLLTCAMQSISRSHSSCTCAMHAFLTGLTYLYVAVLLTVVGGFVTVLLTVVGGLFTVTLDAVLRGLYDVTVTVLNVTVVGG